MARPARTSIGAVRKGCPRCGVPTIRQLVGRMAALNVTADAEPLPLPEALELATPNRLVWCVADLYGGGRELRWLHMTGLQCSLAHVIEHECPPGTPLERRPEGALW